MDTDKALYNRYQNEISDYETFKSIKSKKLKTMLFTGWITQFGSKAIREKMKIPYSTYDYNSRTYGPGTSDDGTLKEQEQKKSKVIDVEGYTKPDDTIITDEQPSQKLIVVEKEPEEAFKERAEAPKEPVVASQVGKLPFVKVEWTNTPDLIKCQLEAMSNVLQYEKGEITVKLEVFKNN